MTTMSFEIARRIADWKGMSMTKLGDLAEGVVFESDGHMYVVVRHEVDCVVVRKIAHRAGMEDGYFVPVTPKYVEELDPMMNVRKVLD